MPRFKADATIVFPSTKPTRLGLVGIIRAAFDQAGEIAIRKGAAFPMTFSILDAEGRLIAQKELALHGSPRSRTERRPIRNCSGLRLPWFVVVSKGKIKKATVRIEVEPRPVPQKAVPGAAQMQIAG